MSDRACVAVITGGGTAGHVFPALAIAEALEAAGIEQTRLHYVGTKHGRERELVPPTGLSATYLDVVGLQRAITLRNAAVVPKAIGATIAARRLLRRLRPGVVVNVGGYGSFPATLAARLARIPTVIVSYDRQPGLVSRLFARGATVVAVAFPGSSLPGAQLTGAPVRRAVLDVQRRSDRAAARDLLGVADDRFVVVVACGSHGSQAVNRAVDGVVQQWRSRRDLCVIHVVGPRNLAAAAPSIDGEDGILYRVIGFSEQMPALYAAADLMVTRGGAGTVAELAAIGAPAIVIPWPDATDDHQAENVSELVSRGGAVLIEESTLTAATLAAEIDRLRAEPAALRTMEARAFEVGALHRSGTLPAAILGAAGIDALPVAEHGR